MVTIVDDICNENARNLSVYSTDLKDAYMDEQFSIINFGLFATMYLGRAAGKQATEYRVIALYDLKNIIPPDAVIAAAVWKLYKTANSCGIGLLYNWEITRCTRADWHEGYVCWDNYKQFTPWTNPGGDYTAPTMLKSPGYGTGWTAIDILGLVQDAHANRDGILNMIWRRTDNLSDDGRVFFCTKSDENPPGPGGGVRAPHVSITYTLEGETHRVLSR